MNFPTISLHPWAELGAALAAGWAFARYFEWSQLFHPSRRLEFKPSDLGLKFEEVKFVSEDGKLLHGWWVPAPAARGTLIYCHGNAGNIGDRVALLPALHALGLNVFLFDYRGYGSSRGFPTEQGTYRDARAAYEVARARYADAESPPILVHGHSLGGAVAIQLALDKPVKGLILEGVFASTVDMGTLFYPSLPVDWLCRFRYDSAAKIGRVRAPKLFLHSRDDEVIPFEQGRKVFDLAPPPKRWFEILGGHSDAAWSHSPELLEELRKFADEALAGAAQTGNINRPTKLE